MALPADHGEVAEVLVARPGCEGLVDALALRPVLLVLLEVVVPRLGEDWVLGLKWWEPRVDLLLLGDGDWLSGEAEHVAV